jgi:hypothetical protein
MRKHCSNVCKLCVCLATESTNSARMHTIMTAALQWQYSQTELTFWIPYIYPAVDCRGLLGRQNNFGMTCIVWDGGRGVVVKVCSATMLFLVWVPWEYSSVGCRNGFIWPMEGRPVKACELLWRDVLGGCLVESVDYLLSCKSLMKNYGWGWSTV